MKVVIYLGSSRKSVGNYMTTLVFWHSICNKQDRGRKRSNYKQRNKIDCLTFPLFRPLKRKVGGGKGMLKHHLETDVSALLYLLVNMSVRANTVPKQALFTHTNP